MEPGGKAATIESGASVQIGSGTEDKVSRESSSRHIKAGKHRWGEMMSRSVKKLGPGGTTHGMKMSNA